MIVILTPNRDCIIYYTIDGSVPTTGSAVYSDSISINVPTTLKFFGVDSYGIHSIIYTEVYT
jgi:hypothetical protein